MAKDVKEIQLMQSRLKEIEEGSKSITNRLELLKKTELEIENQIAERGKKLHKMKGDNFSEIEKLKLEVASMKKDFFAIKHNLRVAINKLKTVARKKEFDELREGLKKWGPFDKATQTNAENIVREMLEKI